MSSRGPEDTCAARSRRRGSSATTAPPGRSTRSTGLRASARRR
jgi:hypothetical protein